MSEKDDSTLPTIEKLRLGPDRKGMANSQRKCLLHILRNLSAVMVGCIRLVEKADEDFTPQQLLTCMDGTSEHLANLITALKNGSFCPLSTAECEFISKLVACHRTLPILEEKQVNASPHLEEKVVNVSPPAPTTLATIPEKKATTKRTPVPVN